MKDFEDVWNSAWENLNLKMSCPYSGHSVGCYYSGVAGFGEMGGFPKDCAYVAAVSHCADRGASGYSVIHSTAVVHSHVVAA